LQTKDKQVHLKGIGEVTLRRNQNARYIRLKIDTEDGIILIVPGNLPEQNAINFAYDKSAWISKTLKRKDKLKKNYTIFVEGIDFKTRFHNLSIMKHEKSTIKSLVSKNQILVWYPEYASIEDQRIQAVIRRAIEEAWRIEAKIYLPERTEELAKLNGFRYSKVSVKKASTRWGSCSSQNNINFNLQLMRLPTHLTDYVILHELVHTKEKNHQGPFWSLLEKVLPGARKMDKELNKYDLKYW
jgi:predicted metal-dependent hydrolase